VSGGATLLVSLVLYRPDLALLGQTLATLEAAIGEAYWAGLLGETRILLTDHSPTPLDALEWATKVCRCAASLASLGTATMWRPAVSANGTAIEYDYVGANPGFGAGHNRAFRAGGGEGVDFFLVANPDLEFADDSLSEGLRYLAQHPDCGLLAPHLSEAEGPGRPAAFRTPRGTTLLRRFLGLRGRSEAHYECRDLAGRPFAPDIVSGCCMLWRSAAYARLGGFDERYFLYFEDFDLSRRAALQGLTAYCPTMRVRHHGGGAGRKGWRHVTYMLRSAWRFHRQHGMRW